MRQYLPCMIPGFTTTNFGWSFYNINGSNDNDDIMMMLMMVIIDCNDENDNSYDDVDSDDDNVDDDSDSCDYDDYDSYDYLFIIKCLFRWQIRSWNNSRKLVMVQDAHVKVIAIINKQHYYYHHYYHHHNYHHHQHHLFLIEGMTVESLNPVLHKMLYWCQQLQWRSMIVRIG